MHIIEVLSQRALYAFLFQCENCCTFIALRPKLYLLYIYIQLDRIYSFFRVCKVRGFRLPPSLEFQERRDLEGVAVQPQALRIKP